MSETTKHKITAVTLAYLNATVLNGEAKRIVAAQISQQSPDLVEIIYEPQEKGERRG